MERLEKAFNSGMDRVVCSGGYGFVAEDRHVDYSVGLYGSDLSCDLSSCGEAADIEDEVSHVVKSAVGQADGHGAVCLVCHPYPEVLEELSESPAELVSDRRIGIIDSYVADLVRAGWTASWFLPGLTTPPIWNMYGQSTGKLW